MASLHPRYRNFNRVRPGTTQQSQTSNACTRMSGCGSLRCHDQHSTTARPTVAPAKCTAGGLSSSHVDRLRRLRTQQRTIPTPSCSSASDASPSTVSTAVSTDEKTAVAQQMLLFLEGQPAQPHPSVRPTPSRPVGELRPRRLELPPAPQERESGRVTELEAAQQLLKETREQLHEQQQKTAAAEATAARADFAAEAATARANEAVAAARLEASSAEAVAEARGAEQIARLTRRVHELEKALAGKHRPLYEPIIPFSPSCDPLCRERRPSFACRRTLEYSRSFAPVILAAIGARAGSAESAA